MDRQATKAPGETAVTFEQAQLGERLAGKYMTFQLAQEIYGIEILRVRELIGMMEVTRVPGTRRFVRGVINLRGRVIPVVDLRLKFDMGALQATEHTVIIVVQYTSRGRELTMGVLVDEVLEVLHVMADNIEPPPDFGTGTIDTEYLLGVGKVERKVVMLMDIGRVLTAEESTHVGELTGERRVSRPAAGADEPEE